MVLGRIYCIICLSTGKLYFGQTCKEVQHRWEQHCRSSRNGDAYKFHRAIRKYGEDNFVIEEVMWVEAPNRSELKQKLDYLEKHFIQRYDTRKNGYNMTDGGDGRLGTPMSEEHKRKIAEAKRGKKRPRSVIEAMRRANLGRKLSEEHRKKIAASLRGVKVPSRGRKFSEAQIKYLSEINRGEKNGFYGKHHSEETREKMKKAWEIRKLKFKNIA